MLTIGDRGKMAFRVQSTVDGKRWRDSPFARPFETADDAWLYAAALDQDGLIMPDVRVIEIATGKAVDRPEMGKFQAEIVGGF